MLFTRSGAQVQRVSYSSAKTHARPSNSPRRKLEHVARTDGTWDSFYDSIPPEYQTSSVDIVTSVLVAILVLSLVVMAAIPVLTREPEPVPVPAPQAWHLWHFQPLMPSWWRGT